MQFHFNKAKLAEAKHIIIAVDHVLNTLPENIKSELAISAVNFPPEPEFKGDAGDRYMLFVNGVRIDFFGLGKEKDKFKAEKSLKSFLVKNAKILSSKTHILLSAEPSALLTHVATLTRILVEAPYAVGVHKTDEKDKERKELSNSVEVFWHLSTQEQALKSAIEHEKIVSETYVTMYDLVNAPANYKTANDFAIKANMLSNHGDFSCKILDKVDIEEVGLHALLAVNRGSEDAAKFLLLGYKHPDYEGKLIGLVGKGVTFDTGGLSIKGSNNMHLMKSDMAGAAAVLGIFEAAAKLKLKCNLVGAIPLTDNAVDAKSIKPSDVISSYAGKTIEIIDTDAEGRLILADGVSYLVKNHTPDILIDLATLTGSAVQTFGYHYAALFTSNKELQETLIAAGTETNEKVWPLPLDEVYEEDIKSDIADVKNYSGKPVAGAISAAKFIEFFTEKHEAWAHLDIAGVAFGNGDYGSDRHAKGFGIRLILRAIEKLSTHS
ncbi:MAG: leucyl aminopeptidase family protein [Luteibaculaceae bacterium]